MNVKFSSQLNPLASLLSLLSFSYYRKTVIIRWKVLYNEKSNQPFFRRKTIIFFGYFRFFRATFTFFKKNIKQYSILYHMITLRSSFYMTFLQKKSDFNVTLILLSFSFIFPYKRIFCWSSFLKFHKEQIQRVQ